MTSDDDHPFDPSITPGSDLGIVADTFWRLPGVLRSNSPHAFAAIGPEAARITAPHPVDVPHGLVDELHLMIGPVVVGAGTPLFATSSAGVLRLIDTRTREDQAMC